MDIHELSNSAYHGQTQTHIKTKLRICASFQRIINGKGSISNRTLLFCDGHTKMGTESSH